MIRTVAQVALLVLDYDEGLSFYRDRLGFTVLEDTALPTKRWVRLGLGSGTELLLSRAETDAQRAVVGHQADGRVFLYLHTDDVDADVERLRSEGVTIDEPPRSEPYGKVAVIRDLYGNRLDLIEPR
ncbi:MAG: VOC family protein [Sandaracinus sp.]|nr:VOC family protein [Sandaracinus sp.]